MPDISKFTQGGFDADGYIEAVIQTMGLDGLTEEQKSSYRKAIGERLEREIIYSVIKHLDTEHYEKFKQTIVDKPKLNPAEFLMQMVLDMPNIAENLKVDLEALFEELVSEVETVKDIVNKHNASKD